MFRIAASPAYFCKVSVPMLTEEGKKDTLTFDAKFKRLTRDELKALADEMVAGEINDKTLIERYMVGWRGVADEDGKEIEFSPGARDRVMQIHPTEQCTAKAFLDSIAEARAKN